MKKLNLSLTIEEMKTILSETQGNQLCQGLVGWNISETSKNADGWLLGMSVIKLFLPWSRWYFEPPSRSLLLWCLKYIPNFWHKNYCMGISSYIKQSWLDWQHQNICIFVIDSTQALSPAYIPWLNVPQLPSFSLEWTARGGCVIEQQSLLMVNRCNNWAFSLVVSQSSQKEKST